MPSPDTRVPPPPTPTRLDDKLAHANAWIGAAPGGSVLQHIFQDLLAPPIEARREQWLRMVADVVNDLGSRVHGLTPEKLAADPAWLSLMMQASAVAIRTHREEKLVALRNALLNSKLPQSPDEDDQALFISLVDQLTAGHLRVLSFFRNPPEWGKNHGIPQDRNSTSIWGLMQRFPEWTGRQQYVTQIVVDLSSRGLLEGHRDLLTTSMTSTGPWAGRLTPYGRKLMQFIS